MSEKELCQKIIDHYCDFDIYKEVPYKYGRIDMIIKKGVLTVGVEAKLQFNTDVIWQAYRAKPFCNYSYIAIKEPKSNHSGYELCRLLGVGVLEWSEREYRLREFIKASYQRRTGRLVLQDHMINAIAGIQHNTESEFKITIRQIEEMLKRFKQLDVKTFFDSNWFHYSNSRSAKQCIVKLIKDGSLPQFSIINGQIIPAAQ